MGASQATSYMPPTGGFPVLMLLPFLSLIALPVPLLIFCAAVFLLSVLSPLPWSALLLSFHGAADNSVVLHLASLHPANASIYRLCLALAILVTIPIPTIKRERNGLLVSCLLAVALLFSLSAIPSSSAANLSPRIRGTVDDREGSTIQDARVVVVNQRTEAVFRTRTGSDGSYEFHKLPDGIYSLSVQVPGFQTFTIYGIHLAQDSDYARQIDMQHACKIRAIRAPARTPAENVLTVRSLL
ncbi:carboxypeptidase-like regulatory domain-containing protein [Tunturiibacter gelidiferens]|uniref:carboxypeptidase-like regulatory domain-containing protein n=1 Tax=Tunturiibacter gelidiferens TaxID=3069689 RepID=UPI003D9B5DB4